MNILFIIKNLIPSHGGFNRIYKLAEKGHKIYVITSGTNKPINNRNIRIFYSKPFIEFKNFKFPIFLPFGLINKVIKEYDINIIHCLGLQSTNTISATIISKIIKIPIIVSVQGSSTHTGSLILDSLSKIYDYSFSRFIIKSADKIVLVSEKLLERTLKLGGNTHNIVVINPGVDVTIFNPDRFKKNKKIFGEDIIVIGFFGRLTHLKGILDLVESIKYLKDQSINLLIVGEGPLLGEIENRKNKYNLPILCTGWVNKTAYWYSLTDIFVLPSHSEGLSRAILEAMAMKKIIIVTNVGGASELIKDGCNGFFIKEYSPKDISDKIKYCILNKDKIEKWGKINRKIIIEKYSVEYEVNELEKLYLNFDNNIK